MTDLAEFFDRRRRWLRVQQYEAPDGGYDIAIRVDGTYSDVELEEVRETVAMDFLSALRGEGVEPDDAEAWDKT